MKKLISPAGLSIACIPLGILLALLGIQVDLRFLVILGNIVTYGGILALGVIWLRRRKPAARSATEVKGKNKKTIGTLLIIAGILAPFISYHVGYKPGVTAEFSNDVWLMAGVIPFILLVFFGLDLLRSAR